MKILAIIPARGGSKGIPHKNIADVAGKPLIYYSIDLGLQAIQKGLIDRCIVSTDDDEIASVARNLGAEVPFMRPPEISTDTSKSVDFILHAIDYFERQNEFYDAVLLLQPTSPLRSLQDVENIIKLFENGDQDSLISVYREDHVHEMVSYYDHDGIGIPLNEGHNQGGRRQEHKSIFVRNGAFYLTRAKYIVEEKKVFSERPLLYEMSKAKSVNLDCMEDLELLRAVMPFFTGKL